jgi:hypothetical protein
MNEGNVNKWRRLFMAEEDNDKVFGEIWLEEP